MNKKEILIICLIMCFICSISAVSAVELDLNGTEDNALAISDDNDVASQNDDLSTYSLPINTSVLKDGSDGEGSFSDLNTIINGDDSDVINLEMNYTFDSATDSDFVSGIVISKPIVTINGNGYTINGNNLARIFDIASGSTVYLNGITFLNGNAGTSNGGAIDSAGTIHVDNCKFINNTANRGGSLYLSGHDGTITNSEFVNNSAAINGGAIRVEGNNWRVEESIFTNNNATDGRGGAIYFESSTDSIIDTCDFISNYANINGGAVEWYKAAHNGQLLNSNFINNIANRSGGAVYWYGNTGKIENSSFTGNKALGNVAAPSSYEEITTGGDGGAIMWTGTDGIVYNCTFNDNYASERGGAVFLQGSVEGNCTNTTFNLCNFTSNKAGLNGGAIDWYEGAHDGHVLYSIFKDNVANSNGGAIYWDGHNGQILHSNFTNNTARNITVDPHGNTGDGGAIIWSGINGTIDDCWFIGNNATQRGGGVFLQNCTHGNCSNTTFSHVYFINNTAGVNGGAIDWHKGAQDGSVSYAVFENNTAMRSGGAIFWFGTYGEIINSTFTNNSALGNVLYNNSFGVMTYGGHGGAVMWTGSEGHILNSTFDENKAKVNGGAIFMQGSTEGLCANITIELSNFTNNFADGNGGAVDWYEGARFGKLINSIFDNNTANKNGGAVYWHGLNGTMENVTLINNKAIAKGYENDDDATRGMGGAIYWYGDNGVMNRVNASSNYAYEDGGVLFINGNNIKMYNSTFSDNTAGDDGGVIFWTGSVGLIYNSTFDNSQGTSANGNSKGGAICLTGSYINITKSNFTNSYAKRTGGALFITGNYTIISDSIFNDSSVDKTSEGGSIYVLGNHTRIITSSFDNSSANLGGSIYISGNNATIIGSNFTNGYAYEDGGAIYITGFLTEIYNSTFINNTAADDGGAVYWNGNNGTLAGGVFVNNKGISSYEVGSTTKKHTSKGGTISIIGDNTKISNSNFTDSFTENNNGENVGGTVFITGHYVDLVGCNFNNSVARSSDGGTIYIIGHDVRVINSTIYNSTARKGGAIYVDGVNASVINSTLNNTIAKTGNTYTTNNLGGAVYIKGNNANIIGSEIEDASAYQGGALYLEGDYCNVTNSSVKGGYAYVDGGALYSTGSYSNVYFSNFTSNEARGDGGAMYWHGGKNSRNNTIVGCIFLENVAYANSASNTKGGGAIYWSEGGYYGTIKDSQFINNSVQSTVKADGGAILWDKCHFAVIDNCIFDGDYIETTNTGDVWVQGGAIYLRVDDPYTISNSKFINCYSEKEAGALYVQSNTDKHKILIVNTTFINNVAQSIGQNSNGGGAIQVKQADIVILQNVTFINNTANQGGAVTVLDTKTNVTFIDCTFDNNTANNGNGGGIWANKKFFIYNTTIANGTASGYGGGLYTNADLTYDNLTFINNTAISGGGLYWNKASIKIQNMKFINNTALERGGAIYITNSGTIIQDVNMTGNKAFEGSAIWANKDITLENVYLMENQANSSSLDISFDESTGKIVVLFKGKDKYLNAIYLNGGCVLYCTNVTYWDQSGENNTGATKIRIPTTTAQDTPEGGQNITVRVNGAEGLLVEKHILTDNDGKVYLNLADIISDTDYHEMYVESELNDDTYYTIIKATTRSASQVNASANRTTYHSNSTLSVNVTQGATGNVSVYLGDTFIANITLENSKGSINMSTLVDGVYLPVGNHTLSFVYNGNVKYDKSNTTAILEITKITPVMLLNVTGIGYNLLVNVTVMDGEYNISDATGNVTILVEGRTATIYLGNGQGMTIIYGLPIGNYTVNATYHGDSNYYSITNFTEANVTEKTQTVLVLDVDSEKLHYINETVPIKVSILPAGEGNITLYINGIPHELTLQTVDNLTFVEFNATELKDGINYVFATYEGTEIYAPSWAQDTFNVAKYNSTIKIDAEDIPVGSTEVINITLPEDAEGIIKVLVNGTPYLVELVNGIAQVNVSDLGVGTYNVTVIFEGDKKYYNSTNSTLFNVTKIKPDITVEVANVTYNNDTIVVVTLPEGVSGNVTIKLNDSVVFTEEPIDGKATFVIPDLAAGNYTIEATFNGNDECLASSNTTNFTVFKATPVLNVTVEDINYGESANITVTVVSGVTGTIIIKVNGTESDPLTITDGKVNLTVNGLAVGNYPVEVIYSGNENYTEAVASTDFNVLPIGTVLDVEVHDIQVWDTEYINITIKDVLGSIIANATGNVTININGVDYTAEIKEGIARFNTSDLAIGHKVAWVFYDGDGNLTGSKAMAEFDVGQRTPTINITAQNITVGQDGNITVNVPANATGFVIIEVIGDDTYIRFVSEGKAIVNPKDLKVGNYTVKATYYGGNNDNYTIASAEPVEFTVSKLNTTVTVVVDDINYTETAVVTVTVPEGVEGNITIKLNDTAGTTITLPIFDNKAIFDLSDLAAGNYTVNVTYNGNDIYNINNTESATFEVKQISPEIEIVSVVSNADDNATITVKVNPKVTENVTINVNGKDYTKAVGEDGLVVFTTDVLDYDTYTVTASYAGDKNFTADTDSLEFTTNKTSDYLINITASDIKVGNNTNITVNVPGDATGKVIINLNGTNYTCDINTGKAVLNNISTLKEGIYTVTAYFGNDKYTNKSVETRFVVSKVDTPIIIEVDPCNVGDTAKIVVTVPSDVTKNVTIEIDGKSYTNVTVDGNATFYVANMTYGNKTVVATYVGDDKYRFNSTTANFEVTKRLPATVIVTTDGPINVGENITISVDIPANATGYVVVNVNGTNYTINTTSGHGSVVVPNLGNGTWNVTATYLGDDQYLPNSNKTSFVVNKVDTTIVIDVESIDYGNAANITVTVKDDVTGYITIQINNTRNVTLPVINGKVNWIVEGLAADNYTVYANYGGDAKYNVNNSNKAFEVRQISPEIEIVSVVSNADENATVVVKVDPRVTENVTINVNGKDYTKAVGEEGVVVFTTDVLDYDTYTVTASYAGDKNFTADTDNLEFTTNKTSDYLINITAGDIKVGNNTNITVNVPADATGKVIINLNGTNYTATIENGKAVLNNISTLKEGVYTVTAYFGNDKYANKTVETRFAVSKVNTPISIEVDPIYVGDKAIITVTVPVDVENNVTIEIDGKKYNSTVDAQGKAIFTIENLTAGTKTIVASYAGDDKYLHNTTTSNVVVSKRPSWVTVDVENITTDKDAVINVHVPTNATGNVIISVNGTNYTVNVTNGAGSITVKNLGNGTYDINVTYVGDDQYLPSANGTKLRVDKLNTTIEITVQEPINYGQVANITVTVANGVEGTITIKINETHEITLPIYNGKVTWNVSGLAADNYTVYATYNGNDKYNLNDTAVATFEVKQISPEIEIVSVVSNADGNATVVVKVDSRVTENITINVDGKDYTKAVGEEGVVIFTTEVLDYDTYTVTASYAGDKNFTADTDSLEFTTNKTSDYLINITSSDIKVGNNTNITVNVPGDATGKVIINLNGTNYTATIENGKAVLNNISTLKEGVYTVTAYFGNDKYANKTVETRFAVSKVGAPIIINVTAIYVGDVAIINVTVPNDVENNVTIEIEGKKYSQAVDPTTGKAVFTVENLTAGIKTVTATYGGDDKYVFNSTTTSLTVSKRNSTVNVTVEATSVGSDVTINVTIPYNATGFVVINVDGTDYTVNTTKGKGSLTIPGLGNSTHTVKVTYLGDDQYLSSKNETTYSLAKVESTVKVEAENITVGDKEVITITVPTDATGNVTVEIVGVGTYTVAVANGTGVLVVKDLKVDDYTVKVTYNGDDKYATSENETTFKVSKLVTEDIEVVDQGNGTVVVIVPENATGNVTITVNGTNYTAPVVNGTAVITLDNGTHPGLNNITVVYSGDENHTGITKNATVIMPKYETPINIAVSDIRVDETETIVVKLPEDATGDVTVEINGKVYTPDSFEDGVATFNIDGLAYGNKTATITYSGDDNYVANSTTANFTVNKNPAPISVEVDNSTKGEATINVALPEDATGYVIVNVNGTDYGINLTAGERSVTVPIDASGDYTAKVTYLGDDKYLANSTETEFHASTNKTKANIGAEVDNVPVGEDVVVKVTVPEGGDGNVTVTIGNITNTVPVTGGENEISIPGVPEGTHDVVIDYSGNDKFEPQTVNKKVTIFSSINAENITRGWNSPYDYKAEFLDKEGNVLANTEVQYVINGKTYTAKTDSQGIAFLNTSKLDVGKYNVTIINPVTGEQTTRTTTIVKRLLENKDITMDFRDGTYYTVLAIGDDGKPVGEGEFVDIYVNTIHYSCRTDKNGYARLKINLNPRTYTITAEYKLTKVSNKLVVKQTLKLVKKTVKVKKGKKFVLKAKLKWSNGKAIKGKKIVFKFKGKKYSAKTNSKGIAKVTIKKKVAKKLKKGKKYKYSATYVTNIVKGTVKVKK